jgi:hypothetical protein
MGCENIDAERIRWANASARTATTAEIFVNDF